jgi:hypothetical protein
MARAKETMVTLMLLSLIILGMMYIVAALIDRDRDSIDRIFRKRVFCSTCQCYDRYFRRVKKKLA